MRSRHSLREHVYKHYKCGRMTPRRGGVIRELSIVFFKRSDAEPDTQGDRSRLDWWQGPAGRARAVADYIAGMTTGTHSGNRDYSDPSTNLKYLMSATLQNDCCSVPCMREPTPRRPIWLMRQAGVFCGISGDTVSRGGFLEMCTNPGIACEITLQPVRPIPLDAAI